MNPDQHRLGLQNYFLSRRGFLSKCGMGMGGLALAQLMNEMNLLGAAPAQAGDVTALNPLALASYEKVLMTVAAVKRIEERLQ